MLKPIKKESGITKREKYLSKISENTFFGLWSFSNIYKDQGIKESGIGKELCDLLVIFENKLIIFSDKDIAFNTNIDFNLAWKRWFKKAVIKSAMQLYMAESWLINHSERIYLDKECTIQFPIPINKNSYQIHLIAVTNGGCNVASKHWGGNSSGTFIQIYPFDHRQSNENPFMIGDLFPNKTFVHVLDELSLDLLMKELNTISDFVNYLEDKERNIRNKFIVTAAGEEELLAYFFNGRSEINSSGRMFHPQRINKKFKALSLDCQSALKTFQVSASKSFHLV